MSALERYVPPAHAVPQTERLSTDQLRYISGTELIPRAYRGNVPAMMACVITGRALGLDDMHALRSIHVVDGKATLSAELMVSLVRRRGHSISGEMSAESATAKGRRLDTGDEMQVTWTLEDAKRAGLLGKGNWSKYPGSMLWARAVSQLVRMLFPDAMLGMAYTPDEMGDDAMVIDVPSVDTTGSVLGDGRPAYDGPGEVFEGLGEPGAFPRADAGAEAAGATAPAESASSPDVALAGAAEPPEAALTAGVEAPTAPAPADTTAGGAESGDPVPAPAAGSRTSDAASKPITAAQLTRLCAIGSELGLSEPRQKLIVEAVAGVTSRKLIPRDKYDAVCAAYEAERPEGEQAALSPFVAPAGATVHRDPADR